MKKIDAKIQDFLDEIKACDNDIELLQKIAEMPSPEALRELLLVDLYFHRAIDRLIETEKNAKTKREIEELTVGILNLCK